MAKAKRNSRQPGNEAKLAAVIELGTTSIRMAIAQVQPDGKLHDVDSLQQAVSLGKDTFMSGSIEPATIEDCVNVLRSFKVVLDEYGIRDPSQIKAVATSAVREASNRDAFLDRLYIATGLAVEPLDEAEGHRYTYLAVHPLLRKTPELKGMHAFVVEVGGGSTEVLLLRRGQVQLSRTHSLGSLRMRRILEDHRAPAGHMKDVMENYVNRAVDGIIRGLLPKKDRALLALGGDARFAAAHLVPEWDKKTTVKVKMSGLEKLTNQLLDLSVDDVVKAYHLSYPEAETLGPALLIIVRVAEALGLKHIVVGEPSLRDGVLAEMITDAPWTREFQRQIVNSAVELGRKYDVDKAHAAGVADLARQLFQAIPDIHQLDPRYELLLHIAALLHETGAYISTRAHHKHSMYVISNSNLFGLGTQDLKLVALVARYHRRALPRPTHESYRALDRDARVVVVKLAAILRIADGLERGKMKSKRTLAVSQEAGQLVITVRNSTDVTLEQYAMQEKALLFRQVFGMDVLLRRDQKKATT
jgi:exopolyphosphatase/guanosine-5'-triphosphate,3'-diphosphate pyrophosphatase